MEWKDTAIGGIIVFLVGQIVWDYIRKRPNQTSTPGPPQPCSDCRLLKQLLHDIKDEISKLAQRCYYNDTRRRGSDDR